MSSSKQKKHLGGLHNFLMGAAHIFDFPGLLSSRRYNKSYQANDTLAIYEDWVIVGEDIEQAAAVATGTVKYNHIGSSFEDFLKSEGIYKECNAAAKQAVSDWKVGKKQVRKEQ